MNKLILLLKTNCGINEEGAHAALKMCFHANVWVYRIISTEEQAVKLFIKFRLCPVCPKKPSIYRSSAELPTSRFKYQVLKS